MDLFGPPPTPSPGNIRSVGSAGGTVGGPMSPASELQQLVPPNPTPTSAKAALLESKQEFREALKRHVSKFLQLPQNIEVRHWFSCLYIN